MVSPGGWLEFCFVMRHFGSSDLSDNETGPGWAAFGGWGPAVSGEGGGVLSAVSVGITLSPSASVVVLLKSDFLGFYY
jgi:hypothetical protein